MINKLKENQRHESEEVFVAGGSDRIVGILDQPRAQHWMRIFFLHGQTSTKEDPFAVALAQQFVRQGIAVCRIDLSGHGKLR